MHRRDFLSHLQDDAQVGGCRQQHPHLVQVHLLLVHKPIHVLVLLLHHRAAGLIMATRFACTCESIAFGRNYSVKILPASLRKGGREGCPRGGGRYSIVLVIVLDPKP